MKTVLMPFLPPNLFLI